MKTEFNKLIFVVGFFLILLTAGMVKFLEMKEVRPSSENKRLADKPALDLSNLDKYPPAYDVYYTDHFPFRNTLIYDYNYFSARYLEKSPRPEQVITGKNGWLYQTDLILNGYTGKFHFSQEELEKTVKEIDYRAGKCAEEGAVYYVVILPNKSSVYPEYLPACFRKYPGENSIDQLLGYIKAHSSVKVIDLREGMRAAKKEGQLYLKGDTHWNELGTFLAYQQIIQWLAKDIPLSKPLELSDMHLYDTVIMGGNIIEMIGMEKTWPEVLKKAVPLHRLPVTDRFDRSKYPCPEVYPYPWDYERAYQHDDSLLPGLFVMRDSYTNELMRKLLSSHFGRSTFIFDGWQHMLNLNLIRQERPKIVLNMLMEDFAGSFVKYPDNPELKK
jgi:alginate O-acetyltransferase complex protein AlgJ